jgi:hypothetical protein
LLGVKLYGHKSGKQSTLEPSFHATCVQVFHAARRLSISNNCFSLATRFYRFRIYPSLFAGGELEPCPEAEIVFGTHRACAIYASAQANFALKMADSIRTSLVGAVPADGCEPIWNNSEAVKGSIVVVDRGTCPFADQAMHAQAMGALAVVVVDNKPGAAAFAMPGNFSSVSIPATLITQEDGASLNDGLKHDATTLPIATLKIGPCACMHMSSTKAPINVACLSLTSGVYSCDSA